MGRSISERIRKWAGQLSDWLWAPELPTRECRILAAALALLHGLIFLFGNPSLSTAGDVNIAEYLYSTSRPGFFFISPLLALILRLLARILFFMNVWTWFSIAALVVGEYLLIRVLQRRFPPAVSLSAAFLYFAIFGSEPLNFTQTAAIFGLLALLYLTEDMPVPALICGLLSAEIRWKMALLLVPFAVLILLYRLFIARRKEGAVRMAVQLGVILLIPLLLQGIYRLSPNYREAVRTNALRESIYDYQEQFPSFDEAREAYSEAGIYPSYMGMVYEAYTGDINQFTSEKLSAFEALKEDSRKDLGGYFVMYGQHLTALFFVLINGTVLFLRRKKKALIPACLSLAALLISALYFVHMGRYAWRVSGGVLLACVLTAYILAEETIKRRRRDKAPRLLAEIRQTRPLAYGTLAVVALIAGAILCWREGLHLPKASVTDEGKAAFIQEMDARAEAGEVFLVPTTYYECHNLFSVKGFKTMHNVFTPVSSFVRGRSKDYKELGITNLFEQMLDEPRFTTFYNDSYMGYLRDYYDPSVAASLAKAAEGSPELLLKVARPHRVTGSLPGVHLSNVDSWIQESDEPRPWRYYCFEADLNEDSYENYYLNVEDPAGGRFFSYPLLKDGLHLSGQMLWMNDSWEFAGTRRILVGESDGQCYELVDLTDQGVGFR